MQLHRGGLIGLGVLVLQALGCASTATLQQPMRAVWVTRGDYRNKADVESIVGNCADAGFNTVFFQVRGNGTAYYRSTIEPWAEELGGEDPGFDPLQTAIDTARRRDVDLHAWVNVMPAWRGTRPPSDPNQLYHARPEWFWYDQYGKRQALSDFYVSLNPCLPEVREYIVSVFEDIVARYDVDGLHLDYIRFPNEPPATPRGTDVDYPRDERTLALFKAATDQTPESDPNAWKAWRTEQVTQLVSDIRAMMQRVKPGLPLTAAVGSIRKNGLTHFQDGEAWRARELVDALILMNYTDDPNEFDRRITPWVRSEGAAAIVPGLWFGRHPGLSTEEAAERVRQQIEIAANRTGNFCIFSYRGLYGDAAESVGQDPELKPSRQETTRAVRRKILLPYIHALAATAERG